MVQVNRHHTYTTSNYLCPHCGMTRGSSMVAGSLTVCMDYVESANKSSCHTTRCTRSLLTLPCGLVALLLIGLQVSHGSRYSPSVIYTMLQYGVTASFLYMYVEPTTRFSVYYYTLIVLVISHGRGTTGIK